MLSSVSSVFLHMINIISHNSRPQLGLSIKSCKYDPGYGITSACTLGRYFSSHAAVFGFWASLPPDNITLNPAYKKTDQSLIFREALVQLLMSLYRAS